ncbi:kinase-like domain-containing protein [Chaetomium sp. MPI-SDFR-AT-0129]|nr:kinase-like domain-containing protein [Chaetomium sp. MPI-SDFR-AT-0129]
MLSVRTKNQSSVWISPDGQDGGLDGDHDHEDYDGPMLEGDGAIEYGEDVRLQIAAYKFQIYWRRFGTSPDSLELLKQLAVQGYQDSMQRLKDVRSRDRSRLDTISSVKSWYMTRLRSSKASLVVEMPGKREPVGSGGFGSVFKAVERGSGAHFAVKVVDLAKVPRYNRDKIKRNFHREVKALENLSHPHIIKCLGSGDFTTMRPFLYMPYRDGSLDSLVGDGKVTDELCEQVAQEMLSALDYLAYQNIYHRDIKPHNILYEYSQESNTYKFELGDFGFVNDCRDANTFCGTTLYMPPGLHIAKVQTPKMDISSLYVTIVEVHPDYADFPGPDVDQWIGNPTSVLQHVLATVATVSPKLQSMARKDPEHRASAAQMLLHHYGGKGLTTPASEIPSLDPEPPGPGTPAPSSPFVAPVQAVINFPQQAQQAQPALLPSPVTQRSPLALLPSPLTQRPVQAPLNPLWPPAPAPTLKLNIAPPGAPQGTLLATQRNRQQREETQQREHLPEALRPQKAGVTKKRLQRNPRAFGTSTSSGIGVEASETPETPASPFDPFSKFPAANGRARLQEQAQEKTTTLEELLQDQHRRREYFRRQQRNAEEKKRVAADVAAREKREEARRAAKDEKEKKVQDGGPDIMQSVIYYGMPGAFPTS